MESYSCKLTHANVRRLNTVKFLSVYALAGCLSFAGCGGPPEDIADVQGEVRLDDAPLSQATVQFQSVDDPGIIYIARTDADGKFHLMHGRGLAGAKLGEYKIRVTTAEPGNPDATPPLPAQPETVPDRYSGSESELRETIVSGENQLKIELKTP